MQWSEPIRYSFEILIPWWQSFWFKLFIVLSILLVMVLMHNWRINWLKERKKYLELQILERTKEIKSKNDEILAQNEELTQQGEELEAQRDMLSEQNQLLEESKNQIAAQNEKLEYSVKERTKEVVEKALELEERYLQLEQFSNVTAHNIRGPVARILGLSQLINLNKLDADDAEIIDKMISNTKDLDIIIHELGQILNFSIDDTHSKELCNTKELIIQSLKDFEEDFKNCKVEINVSVKVLEVRVFKEYMINIIQNILSNSYKYKKQKETLKIEISVGRMNESIIWKFKDNGKGFDTEKYEYKAFEPYQRLNNEIEGRGLGLFIIKRYVKLMKGTIKLNGKPQKGLEVQIQIPD